MVKRLRLLIGFLATHCGCGTTVTPPIEPVKVAQAASARPEKRRVIEFDPKDLVNTSEWFVEDRRRLGKLYWDALGAKARNGLNTEPMDIYKHIVNNYCEGLIKLVGTRVQWPARVDEISEKGVKIYCGEAPKIEPGTTGRAASYYIQVYVNFDQAHFGNYGHLNHDRERTLMIGPQISLDHAKILGTGDKIFIHGTIAGVFPGRFGTQDQDKPPDYVDIFLNDVSVVP
jgi:hypothetical protein